LCSGIQPLQFESCSSLDNINQNDKNENKDYLDTENKDNNEHKDEEHKDKQHKGKEQADMGYDKNEQKENDENKDVVQKDKQDDNYPYTKNKDHNDQQKDTEFKDNKDKDSNCTDIDQKVVEHKDNNEQNDNYQDTVNEDVEHNDQKDVKHNEQKDVEHKDNNDQKDVEHKDQKDVEHKDNNEQKDNYQDTVNKDVENKDQKDVEHKDQKDVEHKDQKDVEKKDNKEEQKDKSKTEINILCPEKDICDCDWKGWTEWTKCDKYCNGHKFRKQLCTCPQSEQQSYSDNECVGLPLTETRSCSMNQHGDLCSNSWGFLPEWSPCISDIHDSLTGTQWRKQFCLDKDGSIYPEENCMFSGEEPLFEMRECSVDQSSKNEFYDWVFDDSIAWSNCTAICGEGIQIRLPYRCTSDNLYMCRPPDFQYESQSCEVKDKTCSLFNELSAPTICNLATSESWTSQQCLCEDSTLCDISNCYGVPQSNIHSCDCPFVKKRLSVESWKFTSWPNSVNTQPRTFSCCPLTWLELINKSSHDDWESLAVEVIAMRLNLLSGRVRSDQVLDDLESAEDLLDICSWSYENLQKSEHLITIMNRKMLNIKIRKMLNIKTTMNRKIIIKIP